MKKNIFKKNNLNENHIVVFTGAGISAPSGIKTFRDNGGLWENNKVEDICNEYNWKENFDLVHNFYNERRVELGNVEPNDAHKFFAKLKRENKDRVTIITQNVDNLFERSGCNVIHLHGFLTEMYCTACGNVFDIAYKKWNSKKDRCPKCNSLKGVKPNIVFFGGKAPNYKKLYDFINASNSHKIMFIVIGTDGSVIDISSHLRQLSCKKIICNKEKSENIDEAVFDIFYEESIIDAIPKIEIEIRDFLNKY